jgi:hypothetical protein
MAHRNPWFEAPSTAAIIEPSTDMTLNTTRLRKRQIDRPGSSAGGNTTEIDIATHAVVAYSSENPNHPLEHLFDGHDGPGGTYWESARPNTTEQIELGFDRPERIACLLYEVEERTRERTQEIRVEVSTDHGNSYHQVIVQDYVFSPAGSTFQREELRLSLSAITHLRLVIVPNKSGAGIATLTSLRLFA